jgi:hypothetical protein
LDFPAYWGKHAHTAVGRPYASLLCTRGCPYACIFCHSIFGTKLRHRSPANVAQEVAALHRQYGIRDFIVADDAFNINLPWAKEVLRAIIKLQLSPRIFEAVAMRTALVLYPGEYSGVLRPHTHYFPLNKDGSNFDAVVNFLRDPAAVKAMTDRAYEDLIRSGLYGYEALARHFDEVVDPLLRSSRSVSVWPVADIRPVAADGSPERLVLEAGHSDPAQVVAALRAGAPTSALLAHNSEFVVPRTRIGRTTVRRFTRVGPGSFEARFRQRLVVGVVDAPAIEMHLYARGKETAVFHTREERRQPLHAALADCVRLMSEGSVFDQPLRVKLSVQGVRQTLTMIVPEPWPTRTLKAAWHLLPLRWRLSPPAMRAKAALRALASPKPRPRQA